MNSLIVQLCHVLERQREILKEMLVAARDHSKALRHNNLTALKQVSGREEKLSGRLNIEDRMREHCQATLLRILGLPEETTLSKLLPHLPEAQKDRLATLADELRALVGEINELVNLNQALTQRAMNYNEQLLRLIMPVNNTYQPDGKTIFPMDFSRSLINKTV